MHRENELAKKAVQFSESFFNKIKPENRICIVGGNIIKNSEDYIFIDVLTSNSSEKIFKYNLLTLDKKNLANWKDRTDFINSVIQFQDEAKWGDLTSFKYLNHLVDRIKVLT